MIAPDISNKGIEAHDANKYIVENFLPKSLLLQSTDTAAGQRDKKPDMDDP